MTAPATDRAAGLDGADGQGARPARPTEPHEGLSPRLRALVKEVQATLGEVVRALEGERVYAAIEEVRREMVLVRDAASPAEERAALGRAARALAGLGGAEQAALARAYTLYLELVNVCENAYRTFRLRARARAARRAGPGAGARLGYADVQDDRRANETAPVAAGAETGAAEARPPGEARAAAAPPRANAVWVLTAHPTESRSPENIRLLRRIQEALVEALEDERSPARDELRHRLHQAWRVGTHPRHRPSVEDEARHLFSLLTDEVLGELVALRREGHRVRLRTWVGGDKDGHPGVGPAQTVASLQLSRERLLGRVARWIGEVARDAALLGHPGLELAARGLEGGLAGLGRVRPGDGGRVRAATRAVRGLGRRYRAVAGAQHPALERVETLLELFPALVVPLELREERGGFAPERPIAAMLHALREVAAGGAIDGYVRGVVVSMTERPEDLIEAARLVAAVLGQGGAIPTVPLFELPSVLEDAVRIIDGAWQDPVFRGAARRDGRALLEVMLGYSDTSKRMGVLASRVAIHDAMRALGGWARERGLDLLFFHGSGGSVGRGGGSFEEQAATWPAFATALIKQTIQGEMVERTLATPEILRRQVEQIAAVQASPPRYAGPSPLTRALARAERAGFEALCGEAAFIDLLASATPYTRLGMLTIGSRPAKRADPRQGEGPALDRLRAIPWVLCWTQTRYLLHAWAGIGGAWRGLAAAEAEAGAGAAEAGAPAARLRAALATDPLLRSHLRQLGFTLAKTAPAIFHAYTERLAPDTAPALVERLADELGLARALALEASPDGSLLPDRAWLLESIYYRAPMIHPLNLLQIDLLSRPTWSSADEMLFRETVTGIAAGMLTTG